MKVCIDCNKELERGNLTNYSWNIKKFCNKNCGNKFKFREKYREDENVREYHNKYWNNLNPEKKREYSKKSREKNKDKIKEYYQKNKDILNQRSKLSNGKRRRKILDIYNNECAICGFKEVLDIHHLNESEVIVLCPNHHTMFHRNKLSKKNLEKYYKKVENEK